MTKITFQDIVDSAIVLGSNKDQNASIPPSVVTTAVNLMTDFILNELVRIYPNSTLVFDKARPFLKRKIVEVNNGLITLPSDYRDILSVCIAVDKTYTSKCECEDDCEDEIVSRGTSSNDLIDVCDPNSPLYDPKAAIVRKEKCEFKKIVILDTDQFDDATMSSLYPPTYKEPIGVFVDVNTIKICPTDIVNAEIRYIKQPKKYNMAYMLMPDDTWQINTSASNYIDLEWERNVWPEFHRGLVSLFALHTRDGNLVQWNNELKKIGFF